MAGFNILRMIRLIRDELLIIVGTSSSETVLPRLLAKLEAAGASRQTVGMVIPTGYSFNLDGTCIYLTLAALFIVQAAGQDTVGIALVVGIDRIMSEGRALTNCIGNGVATMVIARWSGELDRERLRAVLDDPSLVEPEMELHHGGGPEEPTAAEGRHSADPEQRTADGTADADRTREPVTRA